MNYVVAISATPTLDTNAYASGDRMGSVVTLANFARSTGGVSRIVGVSALDKAKQSQAFDVLFFNASPTVASADNAAIDITDAEMEKCVGRITVATGDYIALANSSHAVQRDVNAWVKCAAGQDSLYALLVCRSGTPTYAAGSIILTFYVEQVS